MLRSLPATAVPAIAGVDAGIAYRAVRSDLRGPPWNVHGRTDRHQTAPRDGRRTPYNRLGLPAICRLPVAQLAARNAMLAIWVNAAGVEQTPRVVGAWGFDVATVCEGFFWINVSKAGKPRKGMG